MYSVALLLSVLSIVGIDIGIDIALSELIFPS